MSHEIDLALADRMLEHVMSHDRDIWVQVGKSLAAHFGDQAAELFDRWSARADNYKPSSCATTWRSCLRKPGGYGIGTVIKLAMDGGFRFPQRELSDAERREYQRRRELEITQRARMRAEREAKAQQDALRAMREALQYWVVGHDEGRSEYAARKRLEGLESVRYLPNGSMMVPMVRYDLPREQRLKGLQVIRPDGAKKYTFGMDKEGTSCRLGLVVEREPIIVCEGYATGLSLRMATERRVPVFVAFDAGNLQHVGLMLRQLHPSCPLLFAADDDWKTLDVHRRPFNPGRVYAQEAAIAVQDAGGRASWVHPVFSRGVSRTDGDTDFNDLHRLDGLEAVAEQMDLAITVTKELARG